MPEKPRIGLTTTKPESDKFANYVRAIERAGGAAVPIVPGRTSADAALQDLDGIVLTGGGDVDPALYGTEKHPKTADVDFARDRLEIELVRRAKEEGVPTLCVCRGLQVLNVALDGTLTQHLPDEVGEGVPHAGTKGVDGVHRVDVESGSRLAKILGTTQTSPASSHHQAIDDLAPGLRVVARSPDDGVIEAVEVEGHPWLIGVQWHPERSAEPCQQNLFKDLVRAAREARAKKTGGQR
ncbi:MAG: gamma-glutamyl-gamma-aminobutyrate hydrolase family protein [Planctomycetota bacterium]